MLNSKYIIGISNRKDKFYHCSFSKELNREAKIRRDFRLQPHTVKVETEKEV